MREILVAPFDAEHLDAVCRMEQRIFPDEPWSRQSFEDELGQPFSLNLTALVDGEAAGYLMGSCVADQASVNNLACGESFRRCGVARALMKAFLSQAEQRGASRFSLEVRESNLPAIRLYQEMGFVPVAKRARFYHHPTEDALLMVRDTNKKE